MRSKPILLTTGAVMGAVFTAIVVATVVRAQAPGELNRALSAAGQGSPFAFGTVSAVDAKAGTITLAARQGGVGQVIQVPPDTTITSQQTVKVDDLKSGDEISVRGVPTGITVNSMTAGQAPSLFPAGGRAGAFARQGRAGQGGPQQGMAVTQATGLLSKDPLTLWVNKDTPIPIKMAKDAKVTRFATVKLDGLKVGDQVMASGQTGNDGTFTATAVNVNVNGFGAFGGPFGGGFGGPGVAPIPGARILSVGPEGQVIMAPPSSEAGRYIIQATPYGRVITPVAPGNPLVPPGGDAP